MMQFSVLCPVDGQVAVSIADIVSMVLSPDDVVDVVFQCPECGTRIQVSAHVPHVLLSSLEEVTVLDRLTGERRLHIGRVPRARETDAERASAPATVSVPTNDAQSAVDAPDGTTRARVEAYCEYFRRQIEAAATVDAAIAEMDRGPDAT